MKMLMVNVDPPGTKRSLRVYVIVMVNKLYNGLMGPHLMVAKTGPSVVSYASMWFLRYNISVQQIIKNLESDCKHY